MGKLAAEFENRFRKDFPEHRSSVRFLEFLPEADPRTSDQRGVLHILADLFRKTPQATDLSVFSDLRDTLPALPSHAIQAIADSVLSGSAECHFFPDDPTSRQAPWNRDQGPVCVIVGPAPDRTIEDLLGSTFLSSPATGSQDMILRALQLFTYDHETGHALHRLAESACDRKTEKAEEKRLERLVDTSPFDFETHERNFRERVADVYAAFRLAAESAEGFVSTFAGYRAHAMQTHGDIDHYTSPAVRKALGDVKSGALPSSPRDMFKRALHIARTCPLRQQDVEAEPPDTAPVHPIALP